MGIQGTLIRMAPNHVFEQRAIRDQFAQCTGILGPNTLSFETIQALAQQFGSFSCGDHRTRLGADKDRDGHQDWRLQI